MSELQKVVYHAVRDGRTMPFVFYPGMIIADGAKNENGSFDLKDPLNVYNDVTFSLEPGENFLTENQVKVLRAIPLIAQKIEAKLIELDPPDQPVAQAATVAPSDTRKRPPLETTKS